MKSDMDKYSSTFVINVTRENGIFQLDFLIDDVNILLFEIHGKVYPHRWRSLGDIVEWFEINMDEIMHNGTFPLPVEGNSAAEFDRKCFELDFDEIEKYEILSEWAFAHCWLSAREGAILGNVFFRKVDDFVEISWDNTETYKREWVKVRFLHPVGCKYVKCDLFVEVINNFIKEYKALIFD